MTHQNKAREALDKWKARMSFDKLRQMGLNADDYLTIRHALTLLERMESVDRVALREATRVCDKLFPQVFDKGSQAFVVLKAARIIADMGE